MVSKHSYKEQDLGRAKLPPKIQLLKMFIGYHLTVQINMVLTNMKNVILKSISGLVQMILDAIYGQEHGKVHAYHYISLF